MPARERQLKTIVFSDVVDSSGKIFSDELIAIQQIKADLALICDELQHHGGSLVKTLGDGLLATFDGPTQALAFVQASLQKLAEPGRHALSHRFGLHTGEIYTDEGDILGQGVHLASRLQTVSPANGVAFVRSTYDLIDPRFRRLVQPMGEMMLKGLPEPLQIFCLGPEQLLHGDQAGATAEVQLQELLDDTPYEPVRPLGGSGERRTVLLQMRRRDRQAVMKLIPAGPLLVEALKREAACLDRLRHPRIPRVLDGFARAGLFCFIQEYIPGPSLHGSMELLRRREHLADLLRHVLEVLEPVHAAGLVHGDLHPANLIPDQEGEGVFVVDFSLLKARSEGDRKHPELALATLAPATPAESTLAASSVAAAGRPFFAAPERAHTGQLTPAVDLYALGVSALSLYTGQEPSRLFDATQNGWSLQGLEPEVAGWLAPLLNEQPSRRPPHAAEALRLLDQPLVAAPPSPSRQQSADAVGSAMSKQALQKQLVVTYGPMVDLLLDNLPPLIPPAQWAALRQKLVAAGLEQRDVDQGFVAAQLSDAAEPQTEGPQTEGPATDPPAELAEDSLLPLVREAIGPIADLLWTADRQAAARRDPGSLRQLLAQAGVPEAALDSLMTRVSGATIALDPERKPRPEAAGAATGVDGSAAVAGERLLVARLGPIGSTLWADVQSLPPPDRLLALDRRLRSYGLDEVTLADLRRQLEGG